MNNYDKDVLSFDVVDPLQFIGIDATRKRLEEWFSTFQGPIENEINDLKIELSGDVAFCSRPSGIVKIMGERFTALPVNHPLGHYLEALHLTGYYYTFIGVLQVTTAILLLIPRTALLGALIYFPMILNICILAYAVRFEGTRITTLMLFANIFLLCWDYERLKYILPTKQSKDSYTTKKRMLSNKFPFVFFWMCFCICSFGSINKPFFICDPTW